MTSKEFLKERLFQIFSSIKNISIKYQFLKEGKLHLTEIIPILEYSNPKELMILQTKLLNDFNEKFSPEKLVFVGENSLLNLESPEFSFSRVKGKSIIETRSFMNYSPSFTLTVTEDLEKIKSI